LLRLKTDPNTLLLSTAYLPPVEYFAYLLRFPLTIIEQHETYPKQTYRNRTEIYTDKGKMVLHVPAVKPNGNHTKTCAIIFGNQEKWQLNHWRAIEAAYIASPFFLYYKDMIFPFFEKPQLKLLEMNTRLTTTLCTMIGIETELLYTDRFRKKPENTLDLRSKIHPKKPSTISNFPHYHQVFADRHGFIPNLSIIDLLFNLGPETKSYLEEIIKSNH
jgi:WbqC-like protein family